MFSVSPTKDHGIRVSDQLNTLRNLLENRLKEQDDINRKAKDLSILQSSPATFTKDFLHSYQQSNCNDHSTDLISDVDENDNDDYRQSLHRNFKFNDREKSSDILSHHPQIYSSSLSNDLLRTPIHIRDTKSPSFNRTTQIDTRKSIDSIFLVIFTNEFF